jgi:hypothetical protein
MFHNPPGKGDEIVTPDLSKLLVEYFRCDLYPG